MTRLTQPAVEHVRSVVREAVEDVFDRVAVLHDAVLACHDEARARGEQLRGQDVSALRPTVQGQLAEDPDDDDTLLAGLGFVVAPGVLSDEHLRLEWWQRPRGARAPLRLEVDLNPGSLRFYDYAATEWFDVPCTTSARHVVGPYVDVHGTGRYLLTMTAPVLAEGVFLGVVGADVPVQRFEARVLREVRVRDSELIVLGAERRVVLSTSTRWLTGDLLPAEPDVADEDAARAATYADLGDLPWRLRLADRPRLTRR